MYYVYSKGGRIDPTFQVIEDLLFKYNVNMFICAHVHNTYLSYPVYQGVNNDNGIYHLGVGNGGAPLDLVGNISNTPSWVSNLKLILLLPSHYYYYYYYYYIIIITTLLLIGSISRFSSWFCYFFI